MSSRPTRSSLALAVLLLAACERSAPAAEVEPAAGERPMRPPRDFTPTLRAVDLRCEHLTDPLGLDTAAPRFSWKLESLEPARRGLQQSSYHVLVASSAELLAAGTGDLWDSGRVASRETIEVAYAGRALRSLEHALWKVCVWDRDGASSGWSAPARFGTGVLDPSEWRARWIGFDAPLTAGPPQPDLDGASWIRGPGKERELWLRRDFEFTPREGLRAALVLAAADDYEVFLGSKLVLKGGHASGARRNADLFNLARHLVPGRNVLAVHVRSGGTGGAALACKLILDAGTEREHVVVSDGAWRAAPAPQAGAGEAGFDDSGWAAAVELMPAEVEALGPVDPPAFHLPPPRLLRGEFVARAAPVRATLLASALGVYSLELDGQRVGDDWFAPGWTDYAQRIPYRAYDVTALVRAGPNALGVVLADGWYAGLLGRRGQRDHYGSRSRFLGQVVLEYGGGEREVVATDASWRASVGPWMEADLFMGERYDARAELPGWSSPGFDASSWQPVDVTESVAAPLAAHGGPAVRAIAVLAPVDVMRRGPDRIVFDLGQEIAGVAQLALEAPAGTQVLLRFAEALEPDGSLMRRNLGWARSSDLYVCRGGGPESWQPRFTYHGFRYVEVSGLPPGTEASITGIALSSAGRATGEFRCSDPVVERLVENVRRTLRANSMDVPTDCPQRGERLGWTGDAQLSAETALWLLDVHPLLDKWLIDVADAQREDGQFPAIAPAAEVVADGGPGWADAGVLVPALVHEFTGDVRLVERQLDSMARYLAACERRSGPECRPPAELEGFGDWQAPGPDTPKEVLYLAYFARCARRMAEMTRALGREAEAERHGELAGRIRAAAGELLVDAEGRVLGDTQTAYALALREGLVPRERAELAAARLVEALERNGGRLATGFVGTPELLPALTGIGRSDIAYRLLRSRELPSWGYMVEHGATTVWERWDAWTPEHGFANGGNVSLAHTPLGSVVAWLFGTVAGIRAAEPGFRTVALAPVPGGGLEWAEASHDSVRGRIALRWELAGDELRLDATVPPNVEATLALPTRAPGSVMEGGRALGETIGVRELGCTPGRSLLLRLESGSYAFTCREPVVAR